MSDAAEEVFVLLKANFNLRQKIELERKRCAILREALLQIISGDVDEDTTLHMCVTATEALDEAKRIGQEDD